MPLHKLGFHGSRILAAEEMIRLMFQTLSFVMPEDKYSRSWEGLEEDAVGEFLAQYERDDQNLLSRKRVRYERVESPTQGVALTAEIVTSKSSARLQHDGSWFKTAKIHERLKLRNVYGDLFADVLSKVSLKRVEGSKFPIDKLNRKLAVDQLVWNSAASFAYQKKRMSLFDQLPSNPTLNLLSTAEIIRSFELGLAAGGTANRLQALKTLVSFLRQNESAIPQVLEFLKNENQNEKVATWMIFALEKVGTRGSEQRPNNHPTGRRI